ncbi:MAG: lactate racemase domain-containing protein, partial [Anaerolineales bacterium]
MPYLDISIQYGSKTIDQFLPVGRGTVKVLESANIQSEITELRIDLLSAIENPLNSPPLKDMVEQYYPGSGKKILVLADDNTRPNQHTKLLHPIILEHLIDNCNVNKDDLGILIASGTHRPPTEDEIKKRILGEDLFAEYKDQILIHNDQDNLQDLGMSSHNTPITINKDAYNACLLITVTDSEYHYFAGVAGTVKQLFPGVAGRITINTNHIQMFDKTLGFNPSCRLGNTKGNPVISDMKEMTEKIQKYTPVFCIDAIMDKGEITSLNAGNIISLHDLANELLNKRRVIRVDKPADLVIVSVGKLGINLYQAGKGIHAAWNAVKQPGGTILLLAPCEDGPGSEGYRKTMEAVQEMDLDQALNWVIDNKCSLETFRIGNQKPVDSIRILKTLGENQIIILSEMDPEELQKTYRMESVVDQGSPQESLRYFVDQFLNDKPDGLIYVLKDSGLY